MAIDVGLSSLINDSVVNPLFTRVSKDNPANATGLITQIRIISTVAMEGIEVAAFGAVGDDLTTRGYTSLANQGGAGTTTYTAPTDFTPFEVRTGEYIGFYSTAGRIEGETNVSHAGLWGEGSDEIPCSGTTFTANTNNFGIALYATGVQLGQINIGDTWKDIQNIQINIGDAWKQLCDLEINIGDVWKKGVY